MSSKMHIALVVCLTCMLSSLVLAVENVEIVVGQSKAIPVEGKIKSVAVGNLEVASVRGNKGDSALTIVGKGMGTTTVTIETEQGETIKAEVIVRELNLEDLARELNDGLKFADVRGVEARVFGSQVYLIGSVFSEEQLKSVARAVGETRKEFVVNNVKISSKVNEVIAEQLQTILADTLGKRAEGIKTRVANQRVVVEGQVDDAETLAEAGKIVQLVSPNAVSLLSVRRVGPTIQLNTYIMQVDRGRIRNFGIRTLSERLVVEEHAGMDPVNMSWPAKTSPAGNPETGVTEAQYPRVGAWDMSVNFLFSANLDNETVIELLEHYSLGKLLASPTLISKNGEKAYFLHGMQVPLQTVGDNGSYQIEYKDVGIKLEIEPRLVGGKIDTAVKVEMSSISEYPTKSLNPNIDTKKVENRVVVDNGTTIVLSGLSERAKIKSVTKTPFFGDLPLAGFLFRSTDTRVRDYDFVIFVTPTIVTAGSIENQKLKTVVQEGYEDEAHRSAIFYGLDRDTDNSYDKITPDKEDATGLNPYYDFESRGKPIEYPGREAAAPQP